MKKTISMKCNAVHFSAGIAAMMLISSVFLCACADERIPTSESSERNILAEENTNSKTPESNPDVDLEAEDKSALSTQGSDNPGDENILSQIKMSIGIPFRLWNNEAQVLHCISFFESYAKREVERKTTPAHEEQNELTWCITGNILSITGEWNEDFSVDMSSKTATSQTNGMVYDIVPGNMIDGRYTE